MKIRVCFAFQFRLRSNYFEFVDPWNSSLDVRSFPPLFGVKIIHFPSRNRIGERHPIECRDAANDRNGGTGAFFTKLIYRLLCAVAAAVAQLKVRRHTSYDWRRK